MRIKREEDWHLEKEREAPGSRVDTVFLVEGHRLNGKLFLVLGVTRLEGLQFRLKAGHRAL